MNSQAYITIERDRTLADRLRAYNVVVDGVLVASLRSGDSLTFPVVPGNHVLGLRTDWWASTELPFVAQSGARITFECGNRLTGWSLALEMLFRIMGLRLAVSEYAPAGSVEPLWLERVA